MEKTVSAADTQGNIDIQTGVIITAIVVTESGNQTGKKQNQKKYRDQGLFVFPLHIPKQREQQAQAEEAIGDIQGAFGKFRGKAGHKVAQQSHSRRVGLHTGIQQGIFSKLKRLCQIQDFWISAPQSETVPKIHILSHSKEIKNAHCQQVEEKLWRKQKLFNCFLAAAQCSGSRDRGTQTQQDQDHPACG